LPTARTIRVLAAQPALRWLHPMPNFHLLRQMLEQHVAAAPADLLVLPEVFNGVPCDYDPLAGPLARRFLATLARACRVAIVGGSIDYQDDDGTRRNTCFVVDADGNEVGAYHKRVLFGPEQGGRRAGETAGIFELAGVRVAVLICADLWDPSLARELIDRVDLLCVPAKTTVASESHISYARELWWNLALTRAMETGLPVVVGDWATARHEAHAAIDGVRTHAVHYTSGGSSIVDPGRRPDFDQLQMRLPPKDAGLLAATLDLDAVARFREHRRAVGLLPAAP